MWWMLVFFISCLTDYRQCCWLCAVFPPQPCPGVLHLTAGWGAADLGRAVLQLTLGCLLFVCLTVRSNSQWGRGATLSLLYCWAECVALVSVNDNHIFFFKDFLSVNIQLIDSISCLIVWAAADLNVTRPIVRHEQLLLPVPGTLLSGLGRCRLLEEGAAVFEVLVVFLSSLSGIDPPEAPQVFGLVPLHLLHRGCLALTQLLRPGGQTHAQTCAHTHTVTVTRTCGQEAARIGGVWPWEKFTHHLQVPEPYLASLELFCCSLSFTLRLSSLVILRRSQAPKLMRTRVSYSSASFTSRSSCESVVKLGEWLTWKRTHKPKYWATETSEKMMDFLSNMNPLNLITNCAARFYKNQIFI